MTVRPTSPCNQWMTRLASHYWQRLQTAACSVSSCYCCWCPYYNCSCEGCAADTRWLAAAAAADEVTWHKVIQRQTSTARKYVQVLSDCTRHSTQSDENCWKWKKITIKQETECYCVPQLCADRFSVDCDWVECCIWTTPDDRLSSGSVSLSTQNRSFQQILFSAVSWLVLNTTHLFALILALPLIASICILGLHGAMQIIFSLLFWRFILILGRVR